jgi:VWFA-related protein
VVVVDRDGKPVRGLTRQDFHVFDEGRERPVVGFEAVVAPPPAAEHELRVRLPRVTTNVGERSRPPRAFFLFVYEGMRPSSYGAFRAVKVIRQFVDANAGLDADVTLAATHRGETWTGTVRDLSAPAAFDRAIAAVIGPLAATGANLDPRTYGAGIVPGAPGWASSGMDRMADETRAKRLRELIDHFAAGRSGRTTMILLGEGAIEDPMQRRTKDVVGPAAEHRVVVYGLDVRGLSAPSLGVDGATLNGDGSDGSRPRFAMDGSSSWAQELALATGGRNVRGTERLDVALASVVEESLSYYILGFEPEADAQPGRLRSIEVKLAQKGYDVRARPAYVVPRPGERAAADAPARPPLPLRVAAFVQGPAGDGRSRVRLVLEVDPAALDPDAGGRVTLESQIDAVPVGGGKAQRVENRSDVKLTPELRHSLADAWVPLAREVDLGPGRYEARVVLRAAGTGRRGAVTHAFEVPASGALRITTPVITDLFRQDGGPREIARASFDRARQVECAFEVLGAVHAEGARPRLQARWTLRVAGGETLGAGALERRGDDGTRFSFRLQLGRLADGAYVLSLAVDDLAGGATAEDEVPFEVASGAGSPPG